jgi:ornithine carbamoyltransferase
LKLAYVGDAANNMANSYLIGGATAGMHVAVAAPAGYQPDHGIVAKAELIASTTGGSIEVFGEPGLAIQGADVVVTDTWISMGQEAEKAARLEAFKGYTIDAALFSQAKADAIFMHCLPAYRGYEVASEVIDGPQSVIWDEAENRLHAQKALMAWLAEQSN